jgi:hypothetical protein
MCLRTIIHYWHWAVVMLSWMKDRNEKVQRMTVENNRIEEDDKMLNGIPLNKNVSNTEGRKTRRINKNEKRMFVSCGEALVFPLCWLSARCFRVFC